MNFAQMLAMPVQSLEDRIPDKAIRATRVKTYTRSVANANKAKHDISIERYRKVMGDEWVATVDIENRLGTGRGCVLPTLAKWEKKGFCVRRKKGDPKSWNRNVGYEWRLL